MQHFDLIISNPPYTRNLDLNILNQIYDLSDRICFLHPLTWLYSKKPNNRFLELREKISTTLQLVEKIDYIYELFELPTLGQIVGVTYINKNKPTQFNYDDLDLHGNSEVYKSLRNKILNYCQNKKTCKDIIKTNEKKKYKLITNQMGGCGQTHDASGNGVLGFHYELKETYYTIIPKNKININNDDSITGTFNYYFDSEKETINFRNYLKLKIIRFCLSVYKVGKYIDLAELASVPYMSTYTKSWTNEEVAKELGLTDEELKWAINWVPNFYVEDFEIYK